MLSLGFLVEFEARPGKEADVAQFLVDAKALVDAEPGTIAWFAFQLGPRTFRIFDAFYTEDDRETHLQGKVRQGIEARNEELLPPHPASPLSICSP